MVFLASLNVFAGVCFLAAAAFLAAASAFLLAAAYCLLLAAAAFSAWNFLFRSAAAALILC